MSILMKPATKAFMAEAKKNNNGFTKQIHGYIYVRWTPQYIRWLRNHTLPNASEKKKRRWSEHYHSKVLPLELAESIITIDKDIPLQDLEQVIPYTMARDIVIKSPTEVVLYECGCRAASENGCKPSRVCMVIGKPFTDSVLALHPDRSHRATIEEALQLLRDEDERGHMHTAWFKDACIGRFYAICNCCKCCCVGLRAMMVNGTNMIASSGYSAHMDEGKCKACGKCAKACPFEAITFENKKVGFDWAKCMGCGVCVGQCPQHVWSLALDDKKGIPMDVRMIAQVGPKDAAVVKT